MNKTNRILSVAIPSIFLIISWFCPLFVAKTPSFFEFLTTGGVENIRAFIVFILATLTQAAAMFLMFRKWKYSFFPSIVSFVLFILFTSSRGEVNVDAGLVFLIVTSGILTAVSYYQFIEAFNFTIRDIVEIAMFLGLAVVFDQFVKIRIGANGGSISIAMFPLFVLVMRKGFVKGFIGCGLIYGFINCLLDGYGFIYFPLDYFMAFGSLAILGLFRGLIYNNERRLTIKGVIFLVIGLVLSCTFRLFFATVSGVKYWGMPTYWESLAYNAAYLLPSLGIVTGIMIALYKPLLLLEKIFPTR